MGRYLYTERKINDGKWMEVNREKEDKKINERVRMV